MFWLGESGVGVHLPTGATVTVIDDEIREWGPEDAED